jgi:hypothetical protein
VSDFVNPETRALLRSMSIMPDPWIVCSREDLEVWEAIPTRYRKWVVDHIEEMDAAEKVAADEAALTAVRDAAVAQLDHAEDLLRAVVLVLRDEINLLRAQHGLPARTVAQLRAAVRAKLGS